MLGGVRVRVVERAPSADFALFGGQNAFDKSPPRARAARNQRLRGDIRRGGENLRMLEILLGRPPPIDKRGVIERDDLQMRSDGENPLAQLPLKPRHHGQHNDERGDAQHNAEHRRDRNESHKTIAAPRQSVAQAD